MAECAVQPTFSSHGADVTCHWIRRLNRARLAACEKVPLLGVTRSQTEEEVAARTQRDLSAFLSGAGPITSSSAFLEGGSMLSTSTVNLLNLRLAATPWIQSPDWLLQFSARSATSKSRRWQGKPAVRERRR